MEEKTEDYVNKTSRCSNLSPKVTMESEMWTPSGQKSGRLPKNIKLASPVTGSSRFCSYIHRSLTHWPRIPILATGKAFSPKQPPLCKAGKTIAKGQAAQRESRLHSLPSPCCSALVRSPVGLREGSRCLLSL